MRRALFLALGLVEFTIAGALLVLGWQLPDRAQVHDSFARAGAVTQRAGGQVRILHRQVAGLRKLELHEAADRLQAQTKTVTGLLRSQSIDFETVRTLRDALGDIGEGLDGWAGSLDPAAVTKIGAGLGETASFLQDKVIPAAEQAAGHLEQSTALLSEDARLLTQLLRDAPLDLQSVREIHKSLATFRTGLDQVDRALRLQRLDTMREGFRGMETSLSTGAEQVERLSRYSYPVVTFNGVRPEVNQKPFWPQGDTIAQGMRKAAEGVTAAERELTDLAGDLPKLRASLLESSKVVDRLHDALGMALAQQEKLEPVLKNIPHHAARLANELPKLGGDLARVLRDTRQLKEVATALRQAQQSLDVVRERWPALRTTFAQTVTILRATRAQMDQVLHHREAYETAMQQTVRLADTFATLLPLFLDQVDTRLEEEEHSLQELGQSLDQVGELFPAYEQTTAGVVQTGKLLTWLVAFIVALHGGYALACAAMGLRLSTPV